MEFLGFDMLNLFIIFVIYTVKSICYYVLSILAAFNIILIALAWETWRTELEYEGFDKLDDWVSLLSTLDINKKQMIITLIIVPSIFLLHKSLISQHKRYKTQNTKCGGVHMILKNDEYAIVLKSSYGDIYNIDIISKIYQLSILNTTLTVENTTREVYGISKESILCTLPKEFVNSVGYHGTVDYVKEIYAEKFI